MDTRRVLVLAPHTDDGEFACGGTIARYIEEGSEVYYVAFSSCDKSVPDEYPSDVLKSELHEATRTLGISENRVLLMDYPVREFNSRRQDILEDMIRIERDVKPSMVLLPCQSDTHQDHEVIATEGFRAYKRTSMMGYEMPWNNLTFRSVAFVELRERHLEKKVAALKCYKSQMNRAYASEEVIRSMAVMRGVQIGKQYAEVYDINRMVW